MATQDQANSARTQHADDLAKLGVHAIGVENGEAFGRKGWVVVVYVAPDAAVDLPDALKTGREGNAVNVPLVVEKAEPFEPQ